MVNRDYINILCSRAVLLTYIFIGYLAILDSEKITCQVDPIPAYSVNDQAYPSAKNFPVAMAEHIGAVKQILDLSSFEVFRFDFKLVQFVSQTLFSDFPLLPYPSIFFHHKPTRAPPSFS